MGFPPRWIYLVISNSFLECYSCQGLSLTRNPENKVLHAARQLLSVISRLSLIGSWWGLQPRKAQRINQGDNQYSSFAEARPFLDGNSGHYFICIRQHKQQFSPRGYLNIETHLTRSNCVVIRWLTSSATWKRRKWNISGKCGRNQRVDIVTRILVHTRLRRKRDRNRLRNVW